MSRAEYEAVKILIDSGRIDTYLGELRSYADERLRGLREFVEFVPGDRVTFNGSTRPKYLVGTPATIKKVNRTRVAIRLDADTGRFSSSQDIYVPMALLDPA